MNLAQAAKVDSAVAEFVSKADPKQVPYAAIDEFVERLRTDPEWTQAESIEVRSRLLRRRFDGTAVSD